MLLLIFILIDIYRIKRWQQEIIPSISVKETDYNDEEDVLKGLLEHLGASNYTTTMFSNHFTSKLYTEILHDTRGNSSFHDMLKWPEELSVLNYHTVEKN